MSCLFRNWLNELENERGTFFEKKAGSIPGFHLEDSILRNTFMEGNIENVQSHQKLLIKMHFGTCAKIANIQRGWVGH